MPLPPPRLMGAATVALGVVVMIRPGLLAGPSGHTDEAGRVPRDTRVLMNAMGLRDIATGAAMLLAPEGAPLRTAVATRAACDLGDAVAFGLGLRTRAQRLRIAAGACAWSAACLYSLRRIPG